MGSAANPTNPDLGPLQNNGGPTETEAELFGSPAAGAGDPVAATSALLTTDQRGTGFPRLVSGNVDIGAYELQSPASPPAPGTVTPVDLSLYYNLQGISPDGQKFSGGLDGVGDNFSANQLGSTVTSGAVTYNLGPSGALNVVQSVGQAVNLPAGPFSKLQLLATGVEGNQANQPFVVHYTDGTSQTFTQSLSDWFTPQDYAGESVAKITDYRDRSNGSEDHRNFEVYQYTLNLNTAKTVSTISLPNNGHVEVLAMSLVDPVAVPTVLTPTVVSGVVNLAWTAPSGTVTGYNVFRGTTAGGESSTPLNTMPLSAGTTSFHDAGVLPARRTITSCKRSMARWSARIPTRCRPCCRRPARRPRSIFAGRSTWWELPPMAKGLRQAWTASEMRCRRICSEAT